MTIRYRGRFAPTPSGPLHFGSLVAALGSWLEARTHAGEWLVRIDDLDPLRVIPGAADSILRCLEGLGLEWDGDVVFQSRRQASHHAALQRLRELGLVYACACSRQEIAASAREGSDGPIYPGTCRGGLPPGRVERALRILTRGAQVRFDDAVLGPQSRDLERSAGDFVLLRSDGVFSFHLASAVDDGELAVTHVVRGADLLESSCRQAFLLERLGFPRPSFAHLPVAVDAQGEKLSKQTHAVHVDWSRPAPLLCAALRFLGHAPPTGLERAAARDVLVWARLHWCLGRVPKQTAVPAPQDSR